MGALNEVLAGVRVVEVAQWWFVPAAGAILADWGAEVIKVEHPVHGDPQRGLVHSGLVPNTGDVNYMVEQPNRGKRSVGIDIATDEGRELLYRLVETADVFLTSFLPDARRRLRIDVDDIRARNPNIIYVRGSGQGTRGPDAERGGYDGATFWYRGAIAAALTPPGATDPVGPPGGAFGDSVGAMTIAGGVAAALFRRERTGVASVVDVSLLSAAMWLMAPGIIASQFVTPEMMAGMPRFSRSSPPNPLVNSYRTKDGRWINLCMLQSDRYWPDLCRCIGRPELVDDPRFADARARFENREACVAELDATFATATYAEWCERLKSAAGVWAPGQTVAELRCDPDAVANGYVVDVTRDGTSFQLVANPVQFDETPPTLSPAPEMGAHTEEVLLDLGCTWDDLVAYKSRGAIL